MIDKKKIIEFPIQGDFNQFLEELKTAYKEKRINNFICICDYEYEKGKEVEGFAQGINQYWFGEKSTIYLLGLLEIMKDEILQYLKDKCNEVAEDG